MEILLGSVILLLLLGAMIYGYKQALESAKRDCMLAEQVATLFTLVFTHNIRLKALDNGEYDRSTINDWKKRA